MVLQAAVSYQLPLTIRIIQKPVARMSLYERQRDTEISFLLSICLLPRNGLDATPKNSAVGKSNIVLLTRQKLSQDIIKRLGINKNNGYMKSCGLYKMGTKNMCIAEKEA